MKNDLKKFYREKKVLIIGGAGFIGSNLADCLDGLGAQITIQDGLIPGHGGSLKNLKKHWRFLTIDTRDATGTPRAVKDQDIIFDIAGQPSHVFSMEHPQDDLDINAKGQINILEAVRRHNPKARVIYCSSRQVYGRPQYLPVDEDHPIAPIDGYSISKFAGESYHRLYHQAYGILTTILRVTNVYGPRQNAFDMVGVFMRQAAKGEPLTVFGQGKQVRDFIYVDDLSWAFVIAAANRKLVGKIFNIAGFEHCSIAALAERLAAISGVKVKKVPFPKHRQMIEIGDYYATDKKFRQTTLWQPRVPLDEGLQKTFDYFKTSPWKKFLTGHILRNTKD